jgi:hypothetical protein
LASGAQTTGPGLQRSGPIRRQIVADKSDLRARGRRQSAIGMQAAVAEKLCIVDETFADKAQQRGAGFHLGITAAWMKIAKVQSKRAFIERDGGCDVADENSRISELQRFGLIHVGVPTCRRSARVLYGFHRNSFVLLRAECKRRARLRHALS